jgi:hypothetical protein
MQDKNDQKENNSNTNTGINLSSVYEKSLLRPGAISEIFSELKKNEVLDTCVEKVNYLF